MKTVKIKNSLICFFLISSFFVSCKENKKNQQTNSNESKKNILKKSENNNFILRDLDRNGKLDTISIVDLEKNEFKIVIKLNNEITKEYLFSSGDLVMLDNDFGFYSDKADEALRYKGVKFEFGIVNVIGSHTIGKYLFNFKDNQLILHRVIFNISSSRLWSLNQKRAVDIYENIERYVDLDSTLSKEFDPSFLEDVKETVQSVNVNTSQK